MTQLTNDYIVKLAFTLPDVAFFRFTFTANTS